MLPESWINKIFDYQIAMYGSRFADLWRGTDLEKVKAVWAEKLKGFESNPEAIKEALNSLDDKPWPPSLPEFLQLCRNAATRKGTFVSLSAPSMDKETARARLQQAAEKAGISLRARRAA